MLKNIKMPSKLVNRFVELFGNFCETISFYTRDSWRKWINANWIIRVHEGGSSSKTLQLYIPNHLADCQLEETCRIVYDSYKKDTDNRKVCIESYLSTFEKKGRKKFSKIDNITSASYVSRTELEGTVVRNEKNQIKPDPYLPKYCRRNVTSFQVWDLKDVRIIIAPCSTLFVYMRRISTSVFSLARHRKKNTKL